jgi:formylglycine-generating enzyme required for sulfatase activity
MRAIRQMLFCMLIGLSVLGVTGARASGVLTYNGGYATYPDVPFASGFYITLTPTNGTGTTYDGWYDDLYGKNGQITLNVTNTVGDKLGVTGTAMVGGAPYTATGWLTPTNHYLEYYWGGGWGRIYATGTNAPFSNPISVSITSPASNSTFTAGDTVTINATASDTSGTVSKVEFYQGGTKLGEDTSSPYSYTWTNVAAGNYSLTAKATDNNSATKTSTAVGITVQTAGGSSTMTLDLGGGVNLELILIQAGEFDMGDASLGSMATPVHHVTITKPFYMGKYEVTWAQFHQITGWNIPGGIDPQIPPVLDIPSSNFFNFCDIVSAMTGQKVRLPTEAEWEYACRAGTTTVCFWGDNPDNFHAYANFANGAPCKVGQFLPNPWGLYDMPGNAGELCSDHYGVYSPDPAVDPTGPTGTVRVIRGGNGHVSATEGAQSAWRLAQAIPDGTHVTAFRVVVEAVLGPTISNGGGASDVATVSATLNGQLTSTGSSATVVSVYWGPADNGTNTAGWGHVVNLGQRPVGALSTSISVLTQGATYYYRFYASNAMGSAWANPATQFTTASAPAIDNGSGATSLMPSSARLTGNLTAGGNANIYVCWGTADGGTTTSAWQHVNSLGALSEGAFFCDISGLNVSTTYRYRSYAANVAGTAWASSTATFQTPASLFASWSSKMKITFSGYNKAEALTNFPALVVIGTNLANFSYSQCQSPNGWDLRFAPADESMELNYEIDQWTTNGSSCVWVQVPRLSSSNDFIWAYWGNPGAVSAPAAYTTNGAAWDSNFKTVWHLKENSGNAGDSTANGNIGTNANVTYTSGGRIDGAAVIDSNTDGYTMPSVTNAVLSASIWYYYGGFSGDGFNSIFQSTDSSHFPLMIRTSTGSIEFYNGSFISSGMLVSTGRWYHLCFTASANNYTLYVNGVSNWSWSAFYNNSSFPINGVSAHKGYGMAAYGMLDEMRIENVVRSPNWIWACYMNQASNSLFNSYQVQSGSTSTATTVHGIPYTWLGSYGIANTNNSVETENPDGDSLNNLQEYIVGTDPTNPNSCFAVSITNAAGQVVVRIPSVQATGGKTRYYDIELRTNLFTGSWQPVSSYTNLAGNGSVITCTNITQDRAGFYRVKVSLQ